MSPFRIFQFNTASSDLNTSELELKRAIEMSIQEAKSGSKKKKKKSKKK